MRAGQKIFVNLKNTFYFHGLKLTIEILVVKRVKKKKKVRDFFYIVLSL